MDVEIKHHNQNRKLYMRYITMNRSEREQLIVLSQLKTDEITQVEAALKLRLSTRWVREKFKRYLQDGDIGIVHRSRGRPSSKQWSNSEKTFTLNLLQSEWQGFGPTFAAEKLAELHKIKVSKETIRKAMIKGKIWRPKQRRNKHRKRRERRTTIGLMTQLDGSPHDWFEGRGANCTLLVFIDDATSKLLWLEFAKSESNIDVMQATKNYFEHHGLPHSFYVDFGGVFSVNTNNPNRDKITQWERAMKEVSVEVKHAHSPQAKGRVERSNQTLQDRLIKEMRLAGISSIKQANRFLRESDFIAKHNKKFAVPPAQLGDAHRSVEPHDLDAILSLKEKRVLANDFTIAYNKRIFQLERQQPTIIRPKNEIIVNTSLDGSTKLTIRKVNLMFTDITKRPNRLVPEKTVTQYAPRKPCQNSQRWVVGIPPQSDRRVG